MKRILTLLFLLCTFPLFAQEAMNKENAAEAIIQPAESIKVTKHRIGLNIGGSGTNGEYSETDVTTDASGFAEGGISLYLSYQYTFDKNFAATFMYGSTANRFNAQAYADQLAIYEPRVNWSIQADPYGIGYMMFGVKGFFGDEAKVYVNPIIGFGAMISPEVDVISSGNGINTVSQKIRASEPSTVTILGISFGVDLQVSKLISLNLDVTYLSSEFEIDSELESFDMSGSPILFSTTYDQPFSAVNVSGALAFISK